MGLRSEGVNTNYRLTGNRALSTAATQSIEASMITASSIVASHFYASGSTLGNNISVGSGADASATTSGIVCIAHGLAATPTVARGILIGATTAIASRRIFLHGKGATYLSFLVISNVADVVLDACAIPIAFFAAL